MTMTGSSPAKNDGADGGKVDLTSEELIEKLKKALGKDGDFPASAKVVTELRQLTADPDTTANQVTEIILKEPSLGTRVLHMVNSSFYHRGAPIMTVSQAVLRIGMKPLAELCAGLVLLQKFVPASRRGGAFAGCLRKMVITSLLSSSITSEVSKNASGGKSNECGYLVGALAEMGTLLLAYYFPQVYDVALKRAESKHQDVGKSIFEITGITPLRLSIEIADALNLPEFYKEVLKAADTGGAKPVPDKVSKALPTQASETARAVAGLHAAQRISEAVTAGKNKKDVDAVLLGIKDNLGLDDKLVKSVLGELPDAFKAHCNLIEVDLPDIPEFISTYAASEDPAAQKDDKDTVDPFKQFVDEIRQAVDNREPTASIITTVMETMAWGLKFDRVLLLLVTPTKNSLVGRMLLGEASGVDPKKLSCPIGPGAGPKACEAVAFREGRPVFNGVPVLESGWPFAAMPIGSANKAVGIIYADRVDSSGAELTVREQAAISVLVELLERSINIHA